MQLSRNWADLVKRARAKKLAPAEFTDFNFTISNLGMFDVDTFDAILPPGGCGSLHEQSSSFLFIKPNVVEDCVAWLEVEQESRACNVAAMVLTNLLGWPRLACCGMQCWPFNAASQLGRDTLWASTHAASHCPEPHAVTAQPSGYIRPFT